MMCTLAHSLKYVIICPNFYGYISCMGYFAHPIDTSIDIRKSKLEANHSFNSTGVMLNFAHFYHSYFNKIYAYNLQVSSCTPNQLDFIEIYTILYMGFVVVLNYEVFWTIKITITCLHDSVGVSGHIFWTNLNKYSLCGLIIATETQLSKQKLYSNVEIIETSKGSHSIFFVFRLSMKCYHAIMSQNYQQKKLFSFKDSTHKKREF